MVYTLFMNPIHYLRLTQRLPREHLASEAGCSALVVLRSEQGLYNSIPPVLVRTLVDHYGVDPHQLAIDYTNFQKEQRKFAQQSLADYIPDGTGSPLRMWREFYNLSAVGACKVLCVHQAVWANAESGQTHRLPEQLLLALDQAGFSREFIEDLKFRHGQFVYGTNFDEEKYAAIYG